VKVTAIGSDVKHGFAMFGNRLGLEDVDEEDSRAISSRRGQVQCEVVQRWSVDDECCLSRRWYEAVEAGRGAATSPAAAFDKLPSAEP
jgi:hypothetical protein